MTEPPRDWDKELAAIDRAMASQPSGAPAAPAPVRVGPPGAAPVARAPALAPVAGRRERFATWTRVLLTLALAIALPFWPYAHGCGLGLWLYLGAVGVTGLSGIWAAVSSWRRRQGLAHLLSLLIVAWTLVAGAREVLPRTAYARQSAAWRCA